MRKLLFWMAVVVIFVIPWESGVKFQNFGSITRALGVFVSAGWLGHLVVTGRFRRLRPFHLAVLVFLFWNFISTLWTVSLSATLQRLQTYIQLFILIWLLWDLITSQQRLYITLQAYVLGSWISVANLLENYSNGIDLRGSGRFTAFTFNPNELAALLTLALPLAWYLAVVAVPSHEAHWPQKVFRLVNFAYIPAGTFAILLTGSRNALFSLIPVIWIVLGSLTQLRVGYKIVVTAVLVFTLFTVQNKLPEQTIDRLSTTQEELTEGDLQNRRQIWDQGLKVFQEQPILGVGSGAFQDAIPLGKVAHNTYLSILVEVGIVGFALFCIILLLVLYHIKKHPRQLAALWLTVFIIWSISVTSKTLEHRKVTWLLMSWIVMSSSFVTESRTQWWLDEVNVEVKPMFPTGASYLPPLDSFQKRAANFTAEQKVTFSP